MMMAAMKDSMEDSSASGFMYEQAVRLRIHTHQTTC